MQPLIKALKDNSLTLLISTITIVFLILVSIDASPYLRGPHDRLLESRWPYYFVNTFNKIWAPTVCFAGLILIYRYFQDNLRTRKRELIFLILLVITTFLFQLSLVYFSRFGLGVLFRRMVHPGINGYFSSAVKIDSIPDFISNFEESFPMLDNHGKGHPPGSVILLKSTISLFQSNPNLTTKTLSIFPAPNNPETKELWDPLKPFERAAAISGAFLLHLLTSFTVIPFYYLLKNFSSQLSAQKATMLLALTPSFSFFALFFDPFYAMFPIVLGLFFAQSKKRNYPIYVFFSGLILMLGVFFSYSMLPAFAVIILSAGILTIKYCKNWIQLITVFIWGILAGMGIMYLAGYDFFRNSQIVIESQMAREYLDWIIYNPYDFFVFMGLPIGILFLFLSIKLLRNKQAPPRNRTLLYAFWTIFIALVLSGASRGEVGRIWLPLMIIPIGIVALNFSKIFKNEKPFYVILLLLFLQIIVITEFWVPIW